MMLGLHRGAPSDAHWPRPAIQCHRRTPNHMYSANGTQGIVGSSPARPTKFDLGVCLNSPIGEPHLGLLGPVALVGSEVRGTAGGYRASRGVATEWPWTNQTGKPRSGTVLALTTC